MTSLGEKESVVVSVTTCLVVSVCLCVFFCRCCPSALSNVVFLLVHLIVWILWCCVDVPVCCVYRGARLGV